MYSDDEEDEENPLNGFWLEGDSLAPPCQADLSVVNEIITLAKPSKDSVLFDLGCGDGRICLEATKQCGCRSVGIEIEECLIDKFRRNIAVLGLEDKVQALHEDLIEADLSEATIIVCYLLPDAIELIKDKLVDALRQGATLICNTWGPKELTIVKNVLCGHLESTVNLLLYDSSSISRGLCQVTSNLTENFKDDNMSCLLNYDVLYVTYCSKDKRHDKGNIPAINRYISDRIIRVRDTAASANCCFMILSGSYGFLYPQQEIPYYDHLLVDQEVNDMFDLVLRQFAEYFEKNKILPSSIKYYEVQEDPFVSSYRKVVELISQHHNISLEIFATNE